VFNDANSNGVLDLANEKGITPWTLFLDANNNNQLDAGEVTKQTGNGGSFFFGDLEDGTYFVRQVIQSGFRKTLPGTGVNSYTVVVRAGQARSVSKNKDFGNTTNILLAGTVFNDVNSNGAKDGGEAGIPGVVININSPAGGATIATRTTDANGFWQVKG